MTEIRSLRGVGWSCRRHAWGGRISRLGGVVARWPTTLGAGLDGAWPDTPNGVFDRLAIGATQAAHAGLRWSQEDAVDAASDLMPLGLDCEIAVEAATSRLERLGLQVLRSFDLSTAACVSDPDMPCPHHGSAPCDCHLVVLLVYGEGGPPVSVVAHGHDQQTWFSVVEDPCRQEDGLTRNLVLSAFEEWGLKAGSPDTKNPAT
jgi:hypothetical protein